MEQVVTWAALLAALSAVGAIIKFWSDFNDRIQAVGKDSDLKIQTLREEREAAGNQINTQISAMQADVAMYREQIAREQREFVTREMLRDFEQRIERSMRESAERTVDAIKALTDRIDRAFEDRPARQRGK